MKHGACIQKQKREHQHEIKKRQMETIRQNKKSFLKQSFFGKQRSTLPSPVDAWGWASFDRQVRQAA